MTVLSTIDIIDEPDALSDEPTYGYPAGRHDLIPEDEPDALHDEECKFCGGEGCGWCYTPDHPNYGPSPLCNCGTCPDGGPFTCVRED